MGTLAFCERLSSGAPLFGFLQTLPNATLTEMAGLCGYDFVMLDMEHGSYTDQALLPAVHAAQAAGTSVIVRVPGPEPGLIGRVADLAVDGIVVPGITTGEGAEIVVASMRYPPVGRRGFGAAMHRASRYGIDLADVGTAPNPAVIILLESRAAARSALEIASVQGVDGIMVGPWDLSADAGKLGSFATPAFRDALTSIENAAKSRGKSLGGAPFPDHELTTLFSRGFQFLVIGSDVGLLRMAMVDQIDRARAAVGLAAQR